MRSPFALLLAALVVLAACTESGSESHSPRLTPSTATLLPGMEQMLEVEHADAEALVWSTTGGELLAQEGGKLFVAPAKPGTYVVTARARAGSDAGALKATLTVTAVQRTPLSLDMAAEGQVRGRRGRVKFEARPDGAKGARARFELVSASVGEDTAASMLAVTDASISVLEAHVIDERHATLTFDGVTLDGDGALSEDEDALLRAVVSSGLFPDVAMIPLDTPCADVELEPRVLAALLFPLQLVEKYLTPDRVVQTELFASMSQCRYYTKLDAAKPDTRPSPSYPLLSNGRFVPAAFAYLPLDDKGHTSLPMSAQALLPTDSNVFGPGDSLCRGACGADCEENNCGEPKTDWRCEKKDGRNTGYKQRWKRYTCGEHPGCIEHDACFDNCNDVFGYGHWEAFICMRGCDLQAAMGYGAGQGLEWAQGHGPYTHERSYDYSEGDLVRDDELCPLAFSLKVVPDSGLAPLATDIVWDADSNDSGVERCRLDLGDGSPLIDIEPCPAQGKYSHIYSVPSEMRSATGVYTPKLTRIGAAQTASAEVQARWRFDADPLSGKAPLSTLFSWDGFALVSKKLTCTLDFGDGSAPQVIEDCAKKPGVSHEYTEVDVYVATLTVRGEDRPVKKTLTIEVRDEDKPVSCSHLRDITSWTGSATFSYAASAQQGNISVSVESSGMLQAAALTKSSDGPGGISFMDKALGGTLSHRELSLSSAPHATNPQYDIKGQGEPLPPPSSADGGSNFLLNFDLTECRYNVHVQATVKATSTNGDSTSPAETWVVSFQTPWRPIPNDLQLSDSGQYTAHTDEFILNAPELIEYYWVWNYDLINFVGEAGLGTAQVSWTLKPSP